MLRLVLPLVPATDDAAQDTDVLARWVRVVRDATDACFVLDGEGRLASLSEPAAEMLDRTSEVIGRHVLDGVLELVDFDDLVRPAAYAERIPPLLAASEGVLSRGLLRVRRPDGSLLSLDTIAAPLHDAEHHLVGSVSFFAPLR